MAIPRNDDYELLRGAQSSYVGENHCTPSAVQSRGARTSIWLSTPILGAALLGVAGSLGCFGFTYWLSLQILECPEWALDCHVPGGVTWLFLRLGEVQGVLSALYSMFLSMIVYVTCKLAETTIWPAMAKHSFRLPDVDNFLDLTRGSLPSFPIVIWHAIRGGAMYQILVALIVGIVVSLLFFSSIFVGHAFTLVQIPTSFLSNHTIGAGMGFGFTQLNPPGSNPAAIGQAFAIYTSWANAMSVEPMPEQRDFILDRSNISHIGSVSLKAIQAQKHINCSAFPVNITRDVEVVGDLNSNFWVATTLATSMDLGVNVRFQSELALWVDTFWNVSETRAVTRLVFAAINGTIEDGHLNPGTDTMEQFAASAGQGFNGISSLACDVDIDLMDSQFCMGECTNPLATLSSLDTLSAPGAAIWSAAPRALWGVSVWLAAVTTTFGVSAFGCQPMFEPGPLLTNSTLGLPIAYTTTLTSDSASWSQANLTNFINVASGALGIVMTRDWQLNITGNVTVESLLETPRLHTSQTYALLAPIFIALGGVAFIAFLGPMMYRTANVTDVRLGNASELVISTQTSDIKVVVGEIRKGIKPVSVLETMRLRYGIVSDGYDGLGGKGNVRSFAPR